MVLIWLGCGLATHVAAESSPADAERHYKDGLALVREGRLDEAVQELGAALGILPGHKLILNALGATLVQKGEFIAAEKHLAKALQIDPTLTPARKNLAVGLFQKGDYEKATPHLKELATDPSHRALANLFLGIIEADQGRYEAASGLLESAGPLLFQLPRGVIEAARAHLETGNREKVVGTLTKLERLSGLTARDHVDAAILYSNMESHGDALRHLDAARMASPEWPDIDYQRAVVLSKLGRNAEAVEVLRASTSKSPDGRSLNLLGVLAEEEDHLQLAIDSLRNAIEIEPTVEDHYLDLSLICMKRGSHELGEEILEVGLERMPNSYRLLVQQGAILHKNSKQEAALDALRRAISVEEDHELALGAVATILTLAGDVDGALETLRRGVQQFPEDSYLHYLLGYTLEKSLATADDRASASARAAGAFQRSMELNPRFADNYYRLGKIQVESEPEKAARNFETAIRLDPTNDAAKYQLARLHLKTGQREEGSQLMREIRQAKADQLEEERKPRLGVVRGSRPGMLIP